MVFTELIDEQSFFFSISSLLMQISPDGRGMVIEINKF